MCEMRRLSGLTTFHPAAENELNASAAFMHSTRQISNLDRRKMHTHTHTVGVYFPALKTYAILQFVLPLVRIRKRKKNILDKVFNGSGFCCVPGI